MREMGMKDDHVCMRIDEWVEGSGFCRDPSPHVAHIS